MVGEEFRAEDGCSDKTSICIERDTLILLKCRRGTTDTVEHYRVLCPFTKYYNKWYAVGGVDKMKLVWKKGSNIVHFVVRMMRERGTSYEKMELKKNGEFRSRYIFRMRSMDEILDVKSKLVDF